MEREFKANDIAVIWFVRDECDGWPSRAKLAYVMLYSRMRADRWVWPSKGRLASDMSMGKDAAISALKDLDRMNLLENQQPTFNPQTGAQETTRYRLKPPWEADYSRCPQYAPNRPLSVQPTGGVGSADRGVSDVPTGGVGQGERGLSDQPTGPCLVDRHEVFTSKVNNEGYQEKRVGGPTPLPPDLVSTLQRQVSKRLVLLKVDELFQQYGEKRLRFAGARIEEEKRQRAVGDREALGNPVSLFIGILRTSTDEEADAYFEEQASGVGRGPIAGANGIPSRWEVQGPSDDEDPIALRVREQTASLLRENQLPDLPKHLRPKTAADLWNEG